MWMFLNEIAFADPLWWGEQNKEGLGLKKFKVGFMTDVETGRADEA